MYLSLLGNLSLWSVTSNKSSLKWISASYEIGHVEIENLNREIRYSIGLCELYYICTDLS